MFAWPDYALNELLRGTEVRLAELGENSVFQSISKWLRRRLRSILHRRHKGRGMGSTALNVRWPKGYFAGRGFFDLAEALLTYRRRYRALSP